MACINHNDITYKNLLNLSGLTHMELDARIKQSLAKTGEFPKIELVVLTDTIPALLNRYNIKQYGDHYVVKDSDLKNETAATLNSTYRDLEISLTPLFNGETRVNIKKRATINRDLDEPELMTSRYINDNSLFPQPIQIINGNYIYLHNNEYYISPRKIGSYYALNQFPKTKNLKTAQSKAAFSSKILGVSIDTIHFINSNLAALQSGTNVTYTTTDKLPQDLIIYKNFNYPKFKLDDSLGYDFNTDEDGTILINPKYLDDTPKALERMILKAEGFYNDVEIESILKGLENAIKIEALPSDTNEYILRYTNKDSQINNYYSPESISSRTNRLNQMLDRLEDLYGIHFKRVHNIDLKFGNLKELIPDASRVNAFILNGEIYINMDNAREDAPIHELSHMLLGTLKSTDPKLYEALVNSVETLENYESELEKYPNRTRLDVNEEIFVDIFAKHFTNNLPLPIENTALERAEYEIKHNIDSAIFPSESTTKFKLNELIGKSFSQIMNMFGTSISSNDIATAIDSKDAFEHRKLANVKEDLLKKGLLKEYCE